MMPMAHAARGLEVSDMQSCCTCAIDDLEKEHRKICFCQALISSSSSCDNVPSAMPSSGDYKEEKEQQDMTVHANNSSFFSSSCGNVPFSCAAATRTSVCNEEDEEEEEIDMNICAYTDSPSASSSCGNVPSSSIVAATRTTTLGNVVTHSGASSIMPINNKEDEEMEGGVEGATSAALKCILIMPISREGDEDSIGCITPKAREHQIPEPLVCPPPPQKKQKKHKMNEILASSLDAGNAANPKVKSNSYEQYGSHSFFNPPPDLHTYPNCIKALFKS